MGEEEKQEEDIHPCHVVIVIHNRLEFPIHKMTGGTENLCLVCLRNDIQTRHMELKSYAQSTYYTPD